MGKTKTAFNFASPSNWTEQLKKSLRVWVSLFQELLPDFSHLASCQDKLYFIQIFPTTFREENGKIKPIAQGSSKVLPPQCQAQKCFCPCVSHSISTDGSAGPADLKTAQHWKLESRESFIWNEQ